MDFSGLQVIQDNQLYSVYTPNGVLICQVHCGYDGRYILDAKVLQYICRVLAKRWNLTAK